jgi:hypothetical protein
MGEYKVVSVFAREVAGKITIFNSEGVRITTLPVEALAEMPDANTVKWGEWARDEHGRISFGQLSQAIRDDPWKRKIDGMRNAWRCRTRSIARGRDVSRREAMMGPPGCQTWKSSISGMMDYMSRQRDVHRKRKLNPFQLWAETASNNANRRAKDKAWNKR